MRPRCTIPQWPHGNFAVVKTFVFCHCFKRSSISLYVWTAGACTSWLIKSGICARTAGKPNGIEQTMKLLTRSDRSLVSMFHCRQRVRWQSWVNKAYDFLSSAEAVISRLCLICRVAINPHCTLCYKATGCVSSETSKDKTFKNQPAPSRMFANVVVSCHTDTAVFSYRYSSNTDEDEMYYFWCG